MTGDVERARVNYRRAYAAEANLSCPRCSVGRNSLKPRDGGKTSRTTVPLVLAQAEAKLTEVDRAEHLMGLGQAHLALGDARRMLRRLS